MQALVGIGSGMAKIDPATEFDLQKSKAGPGRIHDLKDSVTQQAIQCHYMPLSPPQMSTPPPSIRNAKKKTRALCSSITKRASKETVKQKLLSCKFTLH